MKASQKSLRQPSESDEAIVVISNALTISDKEIIVIAAIPYESDEAL